MTDDVLPIACSCPPVFQTETKFAFYLIRIRLQAEISSLRPSCEDFSKFRIDLHIYIMR